MAAAGSTFLLPTPLGNENMRPFTLKLRYGVVGGFFSNYFYMLFCGERRFYIGEVPFPITIN